MRTLIAVAALLAGAACHAAGQVACPSPQLAAAAHTVATLRGRLHAAAVPAGSPEIPVLVSNQLDALKDALATAANDAFQCAGVGTSPEAMQKVLATALHANLAPGTDAITEDRTQHDRGAYGADLAVQVFQLFGTPRLFEVDFRFGLECGDDNLLLVFRAASETATDGWHEELRYSRRGFRFVGEALGDFVLLSPLTGSAAHPAWRYLVAHGHPSCGDMPHPGTFSLELLEPTADPARPQQVWHFDHAYVAGESMPRLATTEDTIDFRLVPPPVPQAAREPASAVSPAAPHTHPAAGRAPTMERFRFRLTAGGRVESVAAEAPEASPAAQP